MEIVVNDQTYMVGKLNALQQFHVMRRLAPVLAGMGMGVAELKTMSDKTAESAGLLLVLEKVTEVVGQMTDEESNYVIFTCLSMVKRQVPGSGFASIVTSGKPPQLMFDDIDMLAMLRLTVEVVKESLQGFFKGLGDANSSPSS